MTIEEELALMQAGGKIPTPDALMPDPLALETVPETTIVGDPGPDAGITALEDVETRPELIPNPGENMPDFATDLPAMSKNESAGAWENMGAAWTEDTISRDRRNYNLKKRRALAQSMFSMLPDDAKQRIADRRFDHENNWIDLEDLVLAEIGRDVARDPGRYGDTPLTREAFDAQIIAEQKAELAEAQAVLERPGGLITEFLGAAGSTMASPTQGALMFAGAGAGSVLRIIGTEMAIGGLSEAVDLPDQFAAADRLDQPAPNALGQVVFGAAIGGGLAGAIIGAARVPSFARQVQGRQAARRDAALAARPTGTDALDAEIEVDQAEARLRGETSVQEVVNPQAAPEAGTMGAVLNRGPAFSGVLEAGKGYTIVAGPNGQALRRVGTRAWRNNNPGNIEYGPFAKAQGAVGTDGRFAVFPTYEAGRVAKANLLWASKGYRGKTIGEAINRYAPPFENNTASYASTVARAAGASTNTPMASLSTAQRTLMLDAMERVEGFRPGTENGVAAPAPRRGLSFPDASNDVPSFSPTTRGYTSEGQVTAGDSFRIDVGYEVVDLSTIFRASGEFQPRDRSRIASDAWIADTAARLDPAQLMPSPTADRGPPIVGPNGMIESGNGRYGAIERAYTRHPDRANAYRAQIEAAGFAVPEGVTRPVLIARRKTDLAPEQLRKFTVAAQDSGVAMMTPTEVARASGRAMTAPTLMQLDPSLPLTDVANGGFVRAALANLPRSTRNAMFDKDGLLNSAGKRQLREAIFARAWPDADIIARFAEGDAGELKSLLDALDSAAPAWAALRADIEAGLVTPDMDISGFVLDAMRLIGAARDVAAKDSLPIGKAISELLDEIDLFEGPVAPLTVAMVKKFWTNGRAAKSADVASFLTRYADDARKAGAAGGMFDAPGPRAVLQQIDSPAFADLPEDMGAPRIVDSAEVEPAQPVEDGFDAGAGSVEAQAADAAIVDDLRGGNVALTADDILAEMTATGPRRMIDGQTLDRVEFDRLIFGLKETQPFENAAVLHAAATINHDALNDAAAAAAKAVGLDFKRAPVKKLDRVIQKVTDKYDGDYRLIADVARTGIIARTIDEADAFVAALGQQFHLIDEGWFVTSAGYFDRKLMVRFDDGQLGEIQVWPPGMLEAKRNGGHKLYGVSRDTTQPQAARDQAVADMQALYRGVADQLDVSFAEKLGLGAPRAVKAAAASASDNSTDLSSPSTSSAISRDPASGVQAPLRDQILARPASDTAANSDASNLNSLMGEVPSLSQDTPNMGRSVGEVNTADLDALRGDYGDVPIDMPDGTTATVRELLDDLDTDAGFEAFIQACAITPTGATP